MPGHGSVRGAAIQILQAPGLGSWKALSGAFRMTGAGGADITGMSVILKAVDEPNSTPMLAA
jgi:hypothetical protein